MDLEGHYPQYTISHCIISNETQIAMLFFSGSNFCNARDKSRLNVLLFWFPAGQGLKKVDFMTFLKLVKISYDSE